MNWAKYSFSVVFVVAAAFFLSLYFVAESKGVDRKDYLLDKFSEELRPAESLVPEGIPVVPEFKEGRARLVGTVQEVHGTVVAIHEKENTAYTLKKDLPIFQGDTLISFPQARASVKLHDGSAFAIAPNAKIFIDRSFYNPAEKKRSSLLSLLFGKARFYVAKLKGISDYRVKTPTAVCGVRGSDFALAVFPYKQETTWLQKLAAYLRPVPPAYAQFAGPLATAVITGEQTSISFSGLVGSLQSVGPYQLSWAPQGMAASAGIQLPATMAMGALGAVGPNLSSISMPPGFGELKD